MKYDIWLNPIWDHIGSDPIGQGDDLAAAIRDAGIRCETCEHKRTGRDGLAISSTSEPKPYCYMTDMFIGEHEDKKYFCADHSKL